MRLLSAPAWHTATPFSDRHAYRGAYPDGPKAPRKKRGRLHDPDAGPKTTVNPHQKGSLWRVFRYYFAAGPCGPTYHGSVWWINPRGSLLRAPGPNDASLGRNAKSREIFLGPKPRKNLYMVANASASGSPGARALRAGGGNPRYLRPAAERGTSRKISCPPAGEHAPPGVAFQGRGFPSLSEPSGIAGRPFWRLGPGPGVVRGLVWETGGRPAL
jgi:hypothetical protein